jgi:hypothetical protein
MPPHLQLTLLNVPSSAEGAASLPRPQHVILNHIYIQRGQVRSIFSFFFVTVTWGLTRSVAVPVAVGSYHVCAVAIVLCHRQ